MKRRRRGAELRVSVWGPSQHHLGEILDFKRLMRRRSDVELQRMIVDWDASHSRFDERKARLARAELARRRNAGLLSGGR